MNFKKEILKFNILFLKNLFTYIFFLNFVYFSTSIILTGKYPIPKRLNNGNYVIASITNITFTDSTLSNVLTTKNFEFELCDQDKTGSSTISQFPAEHNGYVLVILFQTLYIFSSTGDFLSQKNTSIVKPKFPAFIIPKGSSGNNYIFTIIYCTGNNNDEDSLYISFEEGIFDSSNEEITFSEVVNFQPFDNKKIYSTISCELMINNNKDYIACLYGVYEGFYISIFDPDNNYIIVNTTYNSVNQGCQFCKFLALPNERKKSIVCGYLPDREFNCYSYDIVTNELTFIKKTIDNGCGYQPTSIIMEYFYETNNFLVGCRNEQNKIFLSEVTNDFSINNAADLSEYITPGLSNVGRINIIIPKGKTQYCFFYHPNKDCNSNECPLIYPYLTEYGSELSDLSDYPTTEEAPNILICYPEYFNYLQTECISYIPDGFFCNDTNRHTIDYCHSNCKTCNSSGTDENNNCLTCPDNGKIYFDLGNCVEYCINDFYIENSIKKCKCSSNISCQFCSVESKQHNLCVSCNDGYFQMKNDPNNIEPFINCYNDDSIPDGYYFNITENQYESCHENCLKCSGAGNNNDNKCIICKSNLVLLKNKNNIENCYSSCNFYYYFDENNDYQCTSNYSCPENYKLIIHKNKCIDECYKDETYKLEYENICYETCPQYTIIKNNNESICELKCENFESMYYNYQKNDCININDIPEGYYCNSSLLKTIDKCHKNCKECNESPIYNNNNCLTCPDGDFGTIYFDLGNCRENCTNGFFIDNNVKKCKCTSFNKCFFCSQESSNNGLCISCNNDEGYYQKSDDEDRIDGFINCYNNESIDDGYFLNKDTKIYEPCHQNCKKCLESGNDEDNKCTICKSGYSFLKNNNNKINCYPDCPKYYYFNSHNNSFYCQDNCPLNYKIINSTKKCIDNCINDEIYNSKYEYNGYCFKECPNGTYISSDNTNLCIAELICDIYYNYEHNDCLTDIPIGFYCNNEALKTIDKCHENCYKCNEGPKENNNSCILCPENGTKYFDLGNCTEKCENGYFEDEIEPFLKCKCTKNIKCNYCSKESNDKNLCIDCNNEKGYYPKSNDVENEDGFINCYKEPEGYYFRDDKYYPCYSSCKNCSESGNEQNNNCISCKSGFDFKNDYEDDYNCYENCAFNYYFNLSHGYHCTNDNSCPKDFPKLIRHKKRCIDDCTKDNSNYKYEYNNECFLKCPNGTHTNSDNQYKCINDLNCENNNTYYNYEKTKCLTDIPIGFFCNNEDLKTIDKCHENCYKCNEGPTENNNNCLLCPENGTKFYDLGNCIEKCENGYFEDEIEPFLKCKCSSDIRCKFCNKESKSYNQCVNCNNEDGYYQKKSDNTNIAPYFNCYKNPEGFFLNNEKNYEECYLSCKFCIGKGNQTDNKCKECKSGFTFLNDFENDNNCYQICNYNYYFDLDKNHYCTNDNNCPQDYNKLIEDKKRCIDECKNDNLYIYEFKNKCYKDCPPNTQISLNNTYLCEKIGIIEEDKEKCKLEVKELLLPDDEISENNVNLLTKDYIKQFGFSYDYVLKKEDRLFQIFIYKNFTCLQIKAKEASEIDFGQCYEKVKNTYNISDDLLITIIKIKGDKKKNTKSTNTYAFSHPETGIILNISEICKDEIITIQEDVYSLIENLDDIKEEYIIQLTKQGIDVFNKSHKFYSDLCFQFKSPNGKDVPMKDRISTVFPNITLCDTGCQSKGVDIERMKVKCECTFNNLMKNNLMDNFYGQTVAEFMTVLNSFNVNVLLCIKEIFYLANFKKCIGGFIILSLLFGQLISIFKFVHDGLYIIRKYIFSLSESYILYMKRNSKINYPIKKKSKFAKINFKVKKEKNTGESSSKHKLVNNNSIKTIKSPFNYLKKEKFSFFNNKRNLSKEKMNINNIKNIKNKKINLLNKNLNISNKKINNKIKIMKTVNSINNKKEYMKKILEFFAPTFDEKDFDDVISKDKRTFCQYFCEKFQNDQIFINAFCIREIFKPRALKFLLLIMTIELYFVINALFYNEEYLSELFNSTKKENFFSFIPRRFNQYIYTSAVSGIISYFMGYFFIDEIKIKRIFVRNKREELKMKYELSILANTIESRFLYLIIFSIILSIICFFYISCFNIVYPYIRKEWIKSSLFILTLMQVLNFLITFIEAWIRLLAIKFNSKRLFRLSLWFS